MDTLWYVTTYSWAERSWSLTRQTTIGVRAKDRPTGGQIRGLLRAPLPSTAIVYCELRPPSPPPQIITEWRDDLVPVGESALSIMARLSK